VATAIADSNAMLMVAAKLESVNARPVDDYRRKRAEKPITMKTGEKNR